jgi:hypothetical protein
MSQQAPWLGEAGQRFIADAAALAKVAETRSLGSINSAEFDAIYLVGGAGADYDFPGNVDLARLVSMAMTLPSPRSCPAGRGSRSLRPARSASKLAPSFELRPKRRHDSRAGRRAQLATHVA